MNCANWSGNEARRLIDGNLEALARNTINSYHLRVLAAHAETVSVHVNQRAHQLRHCRGCSPIHGRKAPLLDRIQEITVNATNKNTIAFGIPKLPLRYGALVMPLLLSVLMTCVVSLISTLKSIGMSPLLGSKWLAAWGVSWLVAFPILLLLLPLVRKATAALVRSA